MLDSALQFSLNTNQLNLTHIWMEEPAGVRQLARGVTAGFAVGAVLGGTLGAVRGAWVGVGPVRTALRAGVDGGLLGGLYGLARGGLDHVLPGQNSPVAEVARSALAGGASLAAAGAASGPRGAAAGAVLGAAGLGGAHALGVGYGALGRWRERAGERAGVVDPAWLPVRRNQPAIDRNEDIARRVRCETGRREGMARLTHAP